MDANEILEQLTDNDIISILSSLHSSHITDRGCIKFQTICHKGDSYKLYYYKETKRFYCYTHCNNIGNLYELLIKVLNIDFKEAYKHVLDFFSIDTKNHSLIEGFEEEKEDSFIYNSIPLNEIEVEPLEPIKNQKICNNFMNFHCSEWLNDNISREVMDLYNIKYCLQQHKIVIPHHNINNKIVGVRARSLDKEEAKLYGKYLPYNLNGNMLNHQLSNNLYGLNVNKKTVKKYKKVIIVEGEKGVLQAHTYCGDNNLTVAICGSKLHRTQIKMLLDLGVEEFIIALDKQYKDYRDVEAISWFNKIMRNIEELINYARVSILWDFNNLLGYKDSPTDKGADIYKLLLKNRIKVDFGLTIKNGVEYDYNLFKVLGGK